MKTLKEIATGKTFILLTWIFAELMLLVLVFAVGVKIGERKAHYSSAWGTNYERNFLGNSKGMMGQRSGYGGDSRGMMGGFGGGDFRNANGISGSIISISDSNIIIKDKDGKENTISVSENTLIKNGRDTIKITDLKNDQSIVVIGKPADNGTVSADLIRIFNK
jgi:hypothetical protein